MTIRKLVASAALAFISAAPALAGGHASGDPAAGEAVFRQCITCHVVVNEAGDTLAGRNARTGPNLYGVDGRVMGSVEGFRYGTGLEEAKEQGLEWTEEAFVAYVQDPTTFLRDATGNSRARGNMAFRVRSEEDALNLYAYLASLSAQ
ncbi:MAG: cytochrome C [Pseudomonadota bacterium]